MILAAFRHGLAMVRAPRLQSLAALALPRAGAERYFLRVPLSLQEESFGNWIIHSLRQHMESQAPRSYVDCIREKPFRREMFLEFPTCEARSKALAFAQRVTQGAYSFFAVGGDSLIAALGDATAVYTKLAV